MTAEWIEIIVYATVSVVLILRLLGVLGRKVDVKKLTDAPSRTAWWDNVPQVEKAQKSYKAPVTSVILPESFTQIAPGLSRSLKSLQAQIPDFQTFDFLYAASQAFAMIFEAFSQRKLSRVAHLINKEVFQSWASVQKAHLDENPLQLRKVLAAEITAIEVDKSDVAITVGFLSEQQKTNPLGPVEEVEDTWVFARSLTSDSPNWILVQTA